MKKIVLASAAMGGAALVAFGASGTFAAYSDSVQAAPAQVAAGSMFLTPGAPSTTSSAMQVSNMAPGDSVTFAIPATNGGSIQGYVSGFLTITGDSEEGCNPAETRLLTNGVANSQGSPTDSTCGSTAGEGELAEALDVTFAYGAVDTAGDCKAGANLTSRQTFGPVPLTAVNGGQGGPGGFVQPDDAYCALMTLTLPRAAGTIVQTDSAAVQLTLNLSQFAPAT